MHASPTVPPVLGVPELPPGTPVLRGRARLGPAELAYEVTGPSPSERGSLPVLLVMGFTMPGRAWRFIVPALSDTRAVCTFDNRGAGESSVPPGPWTMADLAADAARLLDHLGWARAHVVGISMGGMISQHLALDHRDRLASLTLIATHAGGRLAMVPPVRGLLPFVQANRHAGTANSAKRYAALSRLLFPATYLRAADLAAVETLLRHDFEPPAPAEGRKRQLKAVLGHRSAHRLSTLAGLPTLIVKPSDDVLIAPRHSDTLHRLIPGSRLVTMDGAGHGLIRQVPDRLAAAIRAHIDGSEV
jgi:3-oxoadipate enol-lactonase